MKTIINQSIRFSQRLNSGSATIFLLMSLLGLSISNSYAQTSYQDAMGQVQQWRSIAAEAQRNGRLSEAAEAQRNAERWNRVAQGLTGGRQPASTANTRNTNSVGRAVNPTVAANDPLTRGLADAVTQGDYHAAKNMVDRGAKPTVEMVEIAVNGGYTGIAFLLMRSGVNVPPSVLGRAMLRAVEAQDQTRVENLIKIGANVNYSEGGNSPMSIAARKGNLGMINYLVSRGANRDTGSLNELLFAAIAASDTERVRNIVRLGANPNASQGGSTALSIALQRGNLGMASTLVAAGAAADPIVLGRALFAAVQQGQPENVTHLIRMGANVNISSGSKTPLTIALESSNLAIANQLIQAGATDPSGRFGLKAFEAAKQGDMAWLNVLARIPSYANYRNNAGETPLHAAASTGQGDAVALLLRVGADPNVRTVKNWTPLHHAARFGHQMPLMHLLKGGSDVYAVNSDGNDAFKLATLAPRDRNNNIDSTGVINYLRNWMQYNPRR